LKQMATHTTMATTLLTLSIRWQIFVKPVKYPTGEKKLQFHNAQAVARKDVEREFGILQVQFTIDEVLGSRVSLVYHEHICDHV
jgi:hypothetical protein